MKNLRFGWNETKNKTNIAKHKISFEEDETVFFDPDARIISDPDHSEIEERFIILGISRKLRLLIACHCHRASNEAIRIISARKANKVETKNYGG
ncbi:MAG: BrnT family toxin [Elusimicrobiota bacterium]|nr:BrnT family toxin [Elusimicrobiota bacterium]